MFIYKILKLLFPCIIGITAYSFQTVSVEAANINDLLGPPIPSVDPTNYSKLLDYLVSQIARDPTNVSLRELKVRFFVEIGKYNEAISESNYLISNMNSPQAIAFRGAAYYGKANYDQAISDFNYCLRHKRAWVFYFLRGNAYQEKQYYKKALSDYSEAILLKPGDVRAYLCRVDCFSLMGKFDSAIAEADQAIFRDPENANCYSSRGLCYFEKGQYSNALMDFHKGLMIDSNNIQVCNNLAWVMSVCPDPRIRDGKKALSYARKACELSGWRFSYSLGTLASACAETGDFQSAVKWEKKAIEVGFSGPDSRRARKILGLYEKGEPYRVKPTD